MLFHIIQMKKINKTQAEKIIEKSVLALGLKGANKTNPQLIREIVQEFKLDDFKTNNKAIQKFFADSLFFFDFIMVLNFYKKIMVITHRSS